MIQLTDNEFQNIVKFVRDNYGINLSQKRQLIEARMYSVLLQKNLTNFTDYFSLIKQNDSSEIVAMLNKLTTNHTYFMREPAHFDFLKNVILPYHEKHNLKKDIRIWSAGCSSGEEAYTAIMYIMDYFGLQKSRWDYGIYATDISLKAMSAAQNTLYSDVALKDVPAEWKHKYFTAHGDGCYDLNKEVKEQVTFKRFNLMDRFSYTQPYDLIFCRNVMIYFDQETKNNLINKFYDALKPGGYLFIGHSETIMRGTSSFQYIQPAIYQKI